MNQAMRWVTAVAAVMLGLSAHAQNVSTDYNELNLTDNFMDSDAYDPNAANIEDILNQYDKYYEQETGETPWVVNPEFADLLRQVGGCYRYSCAVFLYVSLAEQHAYLHVNGQMVDSWPVSSARKGYSTKRWDGHPNGRIYDRYDSSKYPGGDYKGLGNMPYAVFYYGGFAVHGTASIKNLGHPASHGCVRMPPDSAKKFNRLVRQSGISETWITIQ